MHNILLYSLLLTTVTLSIAKSVKYVNANQDSKPSPQDYTGPWGEGVTCPYVNPPAPNGTTVYTGSVPPVMTTDAINYLEDANFKMFQVSEIKTYTNLTDLYFVMRKEFHTWHYSGGKLLTGCWKGVTVYKYINHP